MKIALIGNPNSGKSSLFNALTGMNQKVGNFPGVTVDRKVGKFRLEGGKDATLIDLPGTYSLYPQSEDERIACEIVHNTKHTDFADAWVVVADATQMRRSLLLCTQMIDLNLPVILVVNMIDLVQNVEERINFSALAKNLGIPVIPVSAKTQTGISTLKKALSQPISPSKNTFFQIPDSFLASIQKIQNHFALPSPYAAYQLWVARDSFSHFEPKDFATYFSNIAIQPDKRLISNEMAVRYDRIDTLLENAAPSQETYAEKWTERLDKVFLHRIGGYVFFLAILWVIFQLLFSVAELPMGWIESGISWVQSLVHHLLPTHFLTDLLVEGLIEGIKNVVVFVPQIAFLFFFVALLEETGYMSRVVFLMDKIMRPFGFSGRSVIPLIGGMACAVPSIMMARTIPNRTERLITIMVTPLMSCSARIPVYVLLVGLFVPEQSVLWGLINLKGLVMLGLYLLGFFMALLAAWVFKIVLKYKSDGIFVSEMPVYRSPRWQNVGLTIWQKSWAFVSEAGKMIVVISMVLWLLKSFAPAGKFEAAEQKYATLMENAPAQKDSLTTALQSEKLAVSYAGMFGKVIEPVIRPLGFDWKIGIALLTSFAAREVFVGTMATIYSVDDYDEENPKTLREKISTDINPLTGKPQYSVPVSLALVIFYAFAMQCMSTLAATKRETGTWKWAAVMLLYLTGLAYLAAWLTYTIADYVI